MSPAWHRHVLSAACVAGLTGLAMMVWSLFDPRPLPVIGAMTVGQAFGTASLLLFLYVVLTDLRPGLRRAIDEAGNSQRPLPPSGDD